jgi:GT2 family glycosyltransferase
VVSAPETAMIDVSIVIVNWNTEKLLLDCIKAVVDETVGHTVEVIVVDNGSTDGSIGAVMECFPKVTLICNERNEGFAKANNIGIAACHGRYVCLVNSDIKVLDGCIDSLCEYMDHHPGIGLVGPQILNKDLSIQLSCYELPSLRNMVVEALFLHKIFPRVGLCRPRWMNQFSHQSSRSVAVLSGCFLMARRKALEEVGSLDERFFIYKEDVDWCKRFQDAGWHIVFDPEARAIHYGGASSAAAPARFLIEMDKANRQYWQKHHSSFAQRVAGVLTLTHYGLRLFVWAATYLLKYGNRIEARERMRGYASCMLRGLRGPQRTNSSSLGPATRIIPVPQRGRPQSTGVQESN